MTGPRVNDETGRPWANRVCRAGFAACCVLLIAAVAYAVIGAWGASLIALLAFFGCETIALIAAARDKATW